MVFEFLDSNNIKCVCFNCNNESFLLGNEGIFVNSGVRVSFGRNICRVAISQEIRIRVLPNSNIGRILRLNKVKFTFLKFGN